ncbi:helix-turn-helix protein [Hydrogenispora ethanolica]|uniref:Helix-turn-helix protein n=1 Tax=Hydrogenispora ethanolica TaxID=1082276 RepID=A0A4R1QWV8_HYDET|nr:helix-turn-helix transcriptional regulator [Hydrogenispora ethanolica]TCL54960.1 helix-turn-helix protein [Hydrogenispora ethanolica]
MSFGEKIRNLRKAQNMSQQELAKILDVHPKHISRYENNVSQPSLEVLLKLRDLFHVSLDYLATDEDSHDFHYKDKELESYFEAVDRLNEEDKQVIKKIIEAMLIKNNQV